MVHKYLLELDGEFSVTFLKQYTETYIDVPVREAQDDVMLFETVINNLSSNGKCKTGVKTSTPWAKNLESCSSRPYLMSQGYRPMQRS